jgi:hypothetical protein
MKKAVHTAAGQCPSGGEHCFCTSHTVTLDVWGAVKKRVKHCCFCGEDKPNRTTKEDS